MNVQNDIKGIPPGVGTEVQQLQRTAATQPVSPAAMHSSAQSSAAEADHTSLSAAASLASPAASVSDMRMEKVAAVQQALADGTYSVSAGDVADKLISHMQGK